MEDVGNRLATLAIEARDSAAFDKLGRSAFNRYYYAAYLKTREALGQMQDQWLSVPHKAIPDLLEETVMNELKRAARKAAKSGGLTAWTYVTSAQAASSGLANLLRGAYLVRIAADYFPETPVERNGKSFSLKDTHAEEAAQWAARARMLCGQLLKNWNALGFG